MCEGSDDWLTSVSEALQGGGRAFATLRFQKDQNGLVLAEPSPRKQKWELRGGFWTRQAVSKPQVPTVNAATQQ